MINNKFIYLKHRIDFDSVHSNIPNNSNPIIFVEDTNQLWTCGHWFSIGYPALSIIQDPAQPNQVKLSIGEDSAIQIKTTGNGLSLIVNSNGEMEFQSQALTTINATFPIQYSADSNTITHGIYNSQGSYGTSTDLSNTRSFQIPYITVDKYGHIKQAASSTVSISLETKQLKIDDQNHRLLLSTSNSDNDEIGDTYKSNIIYNKSLLTIPTAIELLGDNVGITVNNGNVEIKGTGAFIGKFQGDVTGSATPKIHASTIQDYGGASLNLFGHVKLQDIIPITDPGTSSNNSVLSDITNGGKQALVATPKMVYDTIQKIKNEELVAKAYNTDNIEINTNKLNFTQDFELDSNSNLSIRFEEINS